MLLCVGESGYIRVKESCYYTIVSKSVQGRVLETFFYVNLLINIAYYVYTGLYIHIYLPNQAIRVAKLCFYCYFL